MTDNITAPMVLQTVGGLLLAICLGLAGWGLNTAVSNSERISVMEAEVRSQKAVNEKLLSDLREISNETKEIRIALGGLLVIKPADVFKKVQMVEEKLDRLLQERR